MGPSSRDSPGRSFGPSAKQRTWHAYPSSPRRASGWWLSCSVPAGPAKQPRVHGVSPSLHHGWRPHPPGPPLRFCPHSPPRGLRPQSGGDLGAHTLSRSGVAPSLTCPGNLALRRPGVGTRVARRRTRGVPRVAPQPDCRARSRGGARGGGRKEGARPRQEVWTRNPGARREAGGGGAGAEGGEGGGAGPREEQLSCRPSPVCALGLRGAR